MTDIVRIQPGPRMSQAVVHAGIAYLSGQVALNAPGTSVTEQTTTILAQIDALLVAAGTSKEKLLTASIWLADISTFAEMNAVWDAWLAPGAAPSRATVESKLAAPQFTVEIAVTAVV